MMLVGMVSAAWAQVDDVSLVVSGEGATKDEATTKALRSAIEQAFGVFVSANTEILNDELVRDEIATVSSGNVKKYTELGTINKPNGNIEVSLQAIVSVKKLTSYAKSHGSSAEFAGATFAQNLKLVELNRENTKKAYKNLLRQLASIEEGCTDDTLNFYYKDFYDVKLTIGTPRADGTIPLQQDFYTTPKMHMISELIASTLKSLAIPESQISMLKEQKVTLYGYDIPPNTALFSAAIVEKSVLDIRDVFHRMYFYAPVPIIDITLRTIKVYDNLGNTYGLKNIMQGNASLVTYVSGLVIYVSGPIKGPTELVWEYEYVKKPSFKQRYSWQKEYFGGDIFVGDINYYSSSHLRCIVIPNSGIFSNKKEYTPVKIATFQSLIEVPLERLSSITNFEMKH